MPLRASHGNSLLTLSNLLGKPPEAGALVAMRAGRTQPHGSRWMYGHRIGPTVGDPNSSQVIRISLGPNGLQAKCNRYTLLNHKL